MAIFSTGTEGIFSVSYRNLQKKETAVILKCIDELRQNLGRVHNLVHSFDINDINFSIVLYCIVCLMF